MLWGTFIVMLLAAAAVIGWPLYRQRKNIPSFGVLSIVLLIALSSGLYAYIGSPDARYSAGDVPSVEDMLASLEERLEARPDDVDGWKMLGRSYMNLGNFPKSIAAFEKAVELEGNSDGETLISLGEAVLSHDQASIQGRAGQLFESGLALSPNSPRGLFYGGFSALQRNDQLLAADRWEALLNSSPPPEIREVLERRIVEWRGGDASSVADPAASQAIIVRANFTDETRSQARAADSVFVIARDPAQPSPPVAVVRRTVADLDQAVEISDANAMIAGRVPSGFEELEIIVRISPSGQPIARSGDWFGQATIRPADKNSVSIVIDQQVP